MEVLAKYTDLDKVLDEPVAPAAQVPVQRPLQLIYLKPLVLHPPKPCAPTMAHTREPSGVPSIVSAAPPIQQPPAPVLPFPNPMAGLSIFQDGEKFAQLVTLLDASLPHLQTLQSQRVETHMLAERVRELSADLSTSQLDLNEHQKALTALCTLRSAEKAKIKSLTEELNSMRAKAEESDRLKVEIRLG